MKRINDFQYIYQSVQLAPGTCLPNLEIPLADLYSSLQILCQRSLNKNSLLTYSRTDAFYASSFFQEQSQRVLFVFYPLSTTFEPLRDCLPHVTQWTRPPPEMLPPDTISLNVRRKRVEPSGLRPVASRPAQKLSKMKRSSEITFRFQDGCFSKG